MRELTETERKELERLRQVLLTEVPSERFSCDGRDQDKRMCIEPGEGIWYVFFRDGALGEDVTVHTGFEDAALQLIGNVSPSEAAGENMRRLFLAGDRP